MTGRIRAKALEMGFLDCAVVPAGFLEEERTCLNRWMDEGMHGTMHYMTRHADKRLDPRLLVEGARTLVIVLHNYYAPEQPADPEAPIISRYARGKDYHQVIKNKLHELLRFIQTEITPCKGRAFTDSAPILEKAWARRAGLGWIGKNSMLISPEYGSFFFIGELIIDAEITAEPTVRLRTRPAYPHGGLIPETTPALTHSEGNPSGILPGDTTAKENPAPDVRSDSGGLNTEINDHCGTCTRCIEACPTRAIISPRIVDARRCISYQTIELHGDQDPALTPLFRNRLFGCDICQEVCPWNRKAQKHTEPAFQPLPGLLHLTRTDWDTMTEEQFNDRFRESPLMRTGYQGIRRTLKNLKS